MCEICLQYRCPAACPSYERDRSKPSGRSWEFRQKEWIPTERAVGEDVKDKKIVRKIETKREKERKGKERE